MNIFDLTLFFSRLQEYVIQPNGTLTPLNSMQNYLLSEQQAGEILAQVTGQPGDLVLGRSFSVVGVGGGLLLFSCCFFVLCFSGSCSATATTTTTKETSTRL